MKFLEATRVAATTQGGASLPFVLAMSGTPDKLDVFIRAAAAVAGRAADHQTLPFNTLAQWLFSAPSSDTPEVAVLFPWDLLPALDWRSGFPNGAVEPQQVEAAAERFLQRVCARTASRVLYVPAPIPPVLSTPTANTGLQARLLHLACEAGADLLPAEVFSLGSYLSNGSPIAGAHLYGVAEAIVRQAMGARPTTRKVIVTDLDQVMWSGVIGEDGVNGIKCAGEGAGFKHYLYQGMLAKLERNGVMLAAVSRNDLDLALAPFRGGRTLLREDQFVAVQAGYGAKSAQISGLAERLGLGLNAFVFVDDNPVEIAEVGATLPEVECIQFPSADEGLFELLARLDRCFERTKVTAEDRERTALYRRRLAGMVPSDIAGADITSFLRTLDMELVIEDRSDGNRDRAVQLINKTNQFNLNGRRVTEDEVASILAAGGQLYTASLSDQHGSHGEILACLISGTGVIESFVMSCRVLQRRVEYAFLTWLASSERPPSAVRHVRTQRNAPMQQFLDHAAFACADGGDALGFHATRFAAEQQADLALFRVRTPQSALPA